MQTKKIPQNELISGSFRDPSGVVLKRKGSLYRRVNLIYRESYDFLINSGLYRSLVEDMLLIPHQEAKKDQKSNGYFKLIKPEMIPFVSYPYEWSFSQLKHAALATIQIQKRALEFGMSLKDSSAYNIQFWKGKPILIDTLSFEEYKEGQPWKGYRQFCQHFLAPLALMSYRDLRLNKLNRAYIDGIPLDLTSSLLPLSTYLNFSLLTHIHLHARSQNRYAAYSEGDMRRVFLKMQLNPPRVNKLSLLGLIDSLESVTKRLNYKLRGSQWGDYYSDTNYSKVGFEQKKRVIEKFLKTVKPKSVWDLGANTGLFSRIASKLDIPVISIDSDPEAVERNYLRCVEEREENILPLIIDLTNPSPGIGWENKERMSLETRGPVDMIFALALVHHLAVSNNLPFAKMASFFRSICKFLIIEFIPKSDSNVKRLLLFRKDIFPDYTQENFVQEFKQYFTIKYSVKIRHSQRVLFLMEGK